LKRSLVILFLVLISLALLLFAIIFSGFSPTQNNEAVIESSSNILSQEVEQKLKQQAVNQFYSLVDYDLDALDEYAPTYEEMEAFYTVFDEKSFVKRYPVFERAYVEVEKKFGEDIIIDRDYILNVNSRFSAVQVRNQIDNFENVNLNFSEFVIDTIMVEQVAQNHKSGELFNLIIRIYCEEKEGFYDFVNEACWLTDRTCVTNFGWKFLGKYNPYTKKHINSEYHLKDV